MKNAVAILLCAVIGLASAADEYKLRTAEDLQTVRKECGEANKVTEALVAKYKTFEYPDDEITRSYIQCIFHKFDLFDDTKGFKIDNLVAQLGQGKEDKAALKADIEKCADKNEQKSSANAWAFRGFKCFLGKNLPLVQAAVQKN
ncbi:GL17379 [Drosophila persimilis]|uniref:General odorant-binding protein 99a n=2 Tax=pseudoobscura subgroup TaxID=32358 RepID=A0A6I8UUC5_DROPS|nr:general odorant-binding protein 99a [Drosophila pseudoobscura]XP_002017813.1 general odorant-binding protein 99a [Drosophila persimilis]XP_017148268.1 general odorant-binding protein 99a [Drosophila miranda]XP_033246647.1 general odorant-binding protein 99a-like [Drosophila miranda]EDW35652.1 GL17379 [Drosophila persimilis]